ncbi:type I polyketide synthase [Micromonospora lutea]|uniref:Phthiocerol synthesis polyketide synthase type I PpsA n=1 Tax=Micromonospora lutea TaxID=419825 RepID=A0ABQ4IYX4_9ACTN|nr:type I polyketide synthase [Micromonospora lutea]GIJ22938.1 phthiocerol synthesis polyketide synthase type I PpsA [Micromonospora lutea]
MTSSEPIAIVGMACRFAGDVDSPETFWALLRDGRDTVGEIPDDRWSWYARQSPEHAEAVGGATRHGSFLSDIAGFDADFFDITPREAALLDPQQRIVLELAWEALEHAGIPPRGLAGGDAGVFMGVGTDDYGRRLLEDLPRVEAWTGIGGAYCAVANRVSYVLDLHGPSMTVDTACSSSLVAIHLAAQALRAGECDLALAGGVLVMAAPGLTLVLDAAGATAPDGRCKSFDAGADGYGRGEGGGVVVLKRLVEAHRDGDRILAVLRGSAVRQDGRTNGIMAPNGRAQAELMRRACRDADIDPSTVDYVEAHGTGTPVGDPLEAGALAAVYGVGRPPARPLLIGSVKPNIGHLEAGAGVAGVIKTVLALRHDLLPPSLRVTQPNPAVDWESSRMRVVREGTPWPRGDSPRRAAISGYGYGGTIAHLVVEEPDPVPRRPHRPGPDGPRLYPLSGVSPTALRQYADRLATRLEADPDLAATDVGHTLARRRSHLPYRAAVVAAGRAELIDRLREHAATGRGGAADAAPAGEREMVWVFSGHGSHWTGLGRDLIDDTPAFADVFDRLDPIFLTEAGWSARSALFDDRTQPVDVVQPMIFAVQVALAATWRSLGLRPAAVIGHSVGEIAAAVTAGMLTLDQGARLVCRRSALLRDVAGAGAMVIVDIDAGEAQRRLRGRSDVVVAITASPHACVLSGDVAAIAEVAARWRADGTRVRTVNSDVAFHSPQMDPLLDGLRRAAADLPPTDAHTPVYTTALADPRSTAPRDGDYWARNLRGVVRFAQAVTAAAEDGHRLFLEVSGHPIVAHSIDDTLAARSLTDTRVAYSLRRGCAGRETLLTGLGDLYRHGAAVDWSALWPDGDLADLPTPAWQRRRHWAAEPSPPAGATGTRHDRAGHTLLGGRMVVRGACPVDVWLTRLDHRNRPYPGEHPVRGVEIVPAAVLLNTFLAAASTGRGWFDLVDVALRTPVSVTRPREVQVVRQGEDLRLNSRVPGDDPDEHAGWVTHTVAAADPHAGLSARADAPATVTDVLDENHVVDRLATLGVAAMGFPWVVHHLGRTADGLVADVEADTDAPGGHSWAPILDAALSIASVVFAGPDVLRMPAHIARVTLSPAAVARARLTVHRRAEDLVDVELVNAYDEVVGRLTGLRYGLLDRDVAQLDDRTPLVYDTAWRPAPHLPGDLPDGVVLVGPPTPLADGLTARMNEREVPCRQVTDPDQIAADELLDGRAVVVVPAEAGTDDVSDLVTANAWLLARTAQRVTAGRGARLWCVTRGVRTGIRRESLGHWALWGLGRIIGGERPETWGGIVDVGDDGRDLSTLVTLVGTSHREDVVAVRDGDALIPRLRAVTEVPAAPPLSCRPDGTYLISGGLGTLGLEVAAWLAARGARRIVLAGRRGLPTRETWDRLTDPGQRSAVRTIRALERFGVTVAVARLDIADPDQAARLLRTATHGLPPVRGVVHAAGVLDDRTLDTLDEPSLRQVLRPKVAAMTLHTLFPPGSTDFFVLFSSAGQLLGLPGQASYAAGNSFLDGLARYRRAAGDAGTRSIRWTSWRGLGMSTSSAVINAELAARGTGDVSTAEAFSAWEEAHRHDLGEPVVLRVLPETAGGRRPPLLSELDPATGTDLAPDDSDPPWAGLDVAALRAHLRERISAQVADETRLPGSEIDPHRPLSEMGLDSVMTTRIRAALERQFRLPLPTTLLWDRPTVEGVAEYLASHLTSSTDPRSTR